MEQEGSIDGEKGVRVAWKVRVALLEADIRRRVRLLAGHERSIEMLAIDARRRLGSSVANSDTATGISG